MRRFGLTILALMAGVLTASSAFAWGHGPRVVFGFNFGYPGYYYPAPVYYPPPVAVAPAGPTQYVERSEQAPQAGYWYYCETSRGYYPYVKDCPSGWKAVPPAPTPAQ